MTTEREYLGVNLYLKPTYSVVMPCFERKNFQKTTKQIINESNLSNNERKKEMSKKARKRLTNAINWLIVSAKKKKVFNKEKNSYFTFKVNFITLTLPMGFQDISDNYFKKVLLHNFINQMIFRHGLKNYVWKVEAQENGNIHVHITTDTYLPYKSINEVWNRILEKNGIMSNYTDKMNKLTLNEYIRKYFIPEVTTIEVLRNRYFKGKKEGWKMPNTTDVHSVYKIKDVGAYLSKYMAKDEENRRQISGKLWACSYSLSRASKLSFHLPSEYPTSIIEEFWNKSVKFISIDVQDKLSLKNVQIGSLYLYSLNFLEETKNKILKDIYNKVKWLIRTTNFDMYVQNNKIII